jgi:hypothetical protein
LFVWWLGDIPAEVAEVLLNLLQTHGGDQGLHQRPELLDPGQHLGVLEHLGPPVLIDVAVAVQAAGQAIGGEVDIVAAKLAEDVGHPAHPVKLGGRGH